MRAWSVESTFFTQAVGERLGMGGTDFCCLTLLLLEGPLGAGVLAERSGLTTGAVTGMIDRLERGGWVRRAPDPADRRRVTVEPVVERAAELRPLLEPMLAAADRIRSSLTRRDTEVLEGFARASTVMLSEEIVRLRAGPSPVSDDPLSLALTPDLGGEAELELLGMVANITVRAGAADGLLCRLQWDEDPPSLTRRGSRVVVARRKGHWLRAAPPGTVLVSDRVSWSIDVKGGASRLHLDLAAGHLRALSVRGGASQVSVDLPEPDGVVPVRVYGGASKLAFSRPSGVMARIDVKGGVGRVVLDGQRVGPFGTGAAVATGGDPARRYDLDIRGGASNISIEAR